MPNGRTHFPVGVNVFVVKDGKLLLGKRKDESGYHDGEWGLPGGHLEFGEKMVETARRELEEETGLTAREFEWVNADNDTREGNTFHYVHFGFKAVDVEGEVRLMEPDRCYEWQWFPLDALPAPLFIGHYKQIEAFTGNKQFVE